MFSHCIFAIKSYVKTCKKQQTNIKIYMIKVTVSLQLNSLTAVFSEDQKIRTTKEKKKDNQCVGDTASGIQLIGALKSIFYKKCLEN